MLKGTPVILYEKTPAGKDAANRDVFEETPVYVENVLVGPAEMRDAMDMLNLTGKRIVYTLGIPKGDMHDWEDSRIEILPPFPCPGIYHSVGPVTAGIDELVPGAWNKRIQVEHYGKSYSEA